MKIEEFRKLDAETKRLGGAKEVVRQFQLNTTLQDRRNELETGNEALRRTRTILEENMAKRLNDDRLEQEKHEQRMAKIREGHDEFVRRIYAEKTRMMRENDSFRNENVKLKAENFALSEENALSRWVLGIAAKDKKAVQAAAEYLSYPSKYHLAEPPPQLTDSVRNGLLKALGDELTLGGLLVPVERVIEVKTDLAVARKESFNNRLTVQLVLGSLRMFLEKPLELTTDQRRAMLWIFIQIGPRSRQELMQLVNTLQNSETCSVHKGITMIFDDQRSKWICPVLNCTCRR